MEQYCLYCIILLGLTRVVRRPMPEKPEKEIMGEIQAIIRQVGLDLD